MKKLSNSRGFSAVEAILILVIIGLLGFIGWVVLSSQKSTSKTLDETGKSTTPVVAKKTDTDSSKTGSTIAYTSVTPKTAVSDTTTNSGSASYSASTAPQDDMDSGWLPVNEWGVKIPTTSVANPNLRLPLNYEPDTSAPDDSVMSIRVFQGPSSGCSNGNTVPLVFVYRDNAWADVNGKNRVADATFAIAGHTYRVYKDADSQGCFGDTSTVGQDEANLLSQVKQTVAS